MSKNSALIFGYNKYAQEIIANIKDTYEDIRVYSLVNFSQESANEYQIEQFDLSDDWESIEKTVSSDNCMAFCALEDMAENIFLTLSLRANFENLTIIAMALNKESANKLSMAGANKVIPIVETTADIIANMLEKPISSKVLNSILYDESDLKIAQIKINEESELENHMISLIDWSKYNGIITLSLIHEHMKSESIYSKKMKEYVIKAGDILVVVGYENDIKEFERSIGSERYVNWSYWSR